VQSVLTTIKRGLTEERATQARRADEIASLRSRLCRLQEYLDESIAREAEHEKALRVISAIEAASA